MVKMMDPSHFQVERRPTENKGMASEPNSLREMHLLEQIGTQSGAISGGSGLHLLDSKLMLKAVPQRDVTKFVALKIKDFEDAVREQNTGRSQKSARSKTRHKVRARTQEGPRPCRRQQSPVVIPIEQSQPTVPEDQLALWKMETKSYEGVFGFDRSKKKTDFFANLDRFLKKTEPTQPTSKSDVNLKAAAKPNKIKHKPKEIKFEKNHRKPNEKVVAVFSAA